ncbi:preprotein translocase subunit YajC [Sphingomonas sp.]|uniref:preprotein translocase subunit YajC n=1 Tax=Sphingomonas sp. TaxID=28214 RepID=UPI001B1E6AC4|nr:preprotein translocase subunit YajC [Sphingomonas sp.]MBO9713565.1 preprotein translocase subunit YajC [Sphingomonas sp.]
MKLAGPNPPHLQVSREPMLVTPAYAQTAGAAADPTGGILGLAPLILIFVAFYFLMIRPQQKRMKTLQDAVAAVKKGDSVVTAGGIVGKVVKVDEKYVELEIAQGVKVRAVKSTLAEVMASGGAKPAND